MTRRVDAVRAPGEPGGMTTDDREDLASVFVSRLLETTDRGRGFIRKTRGASFTSQFRDIPDEGDPVDPYQLIAWLYIFNPGDLGRQQGFGITMRALHNRTAPRYRGEKSSFRQTTGVERRFAAMLDAHDLKALKRPLEHAAKLAALHHVPFDWLSLLRDLVAWSHAGGRERVRKRWAREFWITAEEGETDPSRDLRARRMELGLSQAEIAEMLGITETSWARYERGESEPPPHLYLAVDQISERLKGGVLDSHD